MRSLLFNHYHSEPMEHIIYFLQSQNPILIYCVLFGFAYVENIFPPSPSDLVIVFGGALAGLGAINVPIALLLSTIGSSTGFITVYYIGKWFGIHILDSGWLKFIPRESIKTVESWFRRWGSWVIVVNRFLSGTRAVISFFAGMSGIPVMAATILCTISALVWNAILLYAGYMLGNNWQLIAFYLNLYSSIVTIIVATALVVWLLIVYLRRRRLRVAQND